MKPQRKNNNRKKNDLVVATGADPAAAASSVGWFEELALMEMFEWYRHAPFGVALFFRLGWFRIMERCHARPEGEHVAICESVIAETLEVAGQISGGRLTGQAELAMEVIRMLVGDLREGRPPTTDLNFDVLNFLRQDAPA